MFDFQEANNMLESEKTEICLPSGNFLPISAQMAIDKIKDNIDIQTLVSQADTYQIDSLENAKHALSMALQARKLVTLLTQSKREITKPQLDFQRAATQLFSDYTEKLQNIENDLKNRIEIWIDQNTEQAFTSGLESMQVVDGSLTRVDSWQFDVEDSSKIPFEYMTPDIEAIEKAIKGGVRNIPGVNIFMKHEVKLRVKN